MPFAGRLGMTLAEAGPDRVVAQLDWAPDLCTAAGILHGGVLMSLADSAGAFVAYLGLAEGKSTATITSTTHMFRPVTSGAVEAVAVPLHRGRTTVTVQTSLHDEAGWSPRPRRSRRSGRPCGLGSGARPGVTCGSASASGPLAGRAAGDGRRGAWPGTSRRWPGTRPPACPWP